MNTVPGTPALLLLTRRELVRFVRQPSRIVAAVGTPALLWLFLAGGFADSFAPPTGVGENGAAAAGNYAAYLLPGVAVGVVMFSAIFAAMSLIEDRRAGFLQSVLVSPAPLWAGVGAKALGGAIVATAQAVLILLAAPTVGLTPGFVGSLAALVAIALTGCAVTALGLAAAWWVNSSEGFHGVMNLLLMPMWLLSGAFFPAAGAAGWLAVIMLINPLRWCTEALRASLDGDPMSAPWAWAGAFVFAGAMLALAMLTMGRGVKTR